MVIIDPHRCQSANNYFGDYCSVAPEGDCANLNYNELEQLVPVTSILRNKSKKIKTILKNIVPNNSKSKRKAGARQGKNYEFSKRFSIHFVDKVNSQQGKMDYHKSRQSENHKKKKISVKEPAKHYDNHLKYSESQSDYTPQNVMYEPEPMPSCACPNSGGYFNPGWEPRPMFKQPSDLWRKQFNRWWGWGRRRNCLQKPCMPPPPMWYLYENMYGNQNLNGCQNTKCYKKEVLPRKTCSDYLSKLCCFNFCRGGMDCGCYIRPGNRKKDDDDDDEIHEERNVVKVCSKHCNDYPCGYGDELPYEHQMATVPHMAPYEHQMATGPRVIPYEHQMASVHPHMAPYEHQMATGPRVIPYEHRMASAPHGVSYEHRMASAPHEVPYEHRMASAPHDRKNNKKVCGVLPDVLRKRKKNQPQMKEQYSQHSMKKQPSQPSMKEQTSSSSFSARTGSHYSVNNKHSTRSSIEYLSYRLESVADEEGEDCCCCCPCKLDVNHNYCQTDHHYCTWKVAEQQTDPVLRRRTCCKCCKKGCTSCKVVCHANHEERRPYYDSSPPSPADEEEDDDFDENYDAHSKKHSKFSSFRRSTNADDRSHKPSKYSEDYNDEQNRRSTYKSTDNRRSSDRRSDYNRSSERRSENGRSSGRPSENRRSSSRPSENMRNSSRPSENMRSSSRPSENKRSSARPSENKRGSARPSENKPNTDGKSGKCEKPNGGCHDSPKYRQSGGTKDAMDATDGATHKFRNNNETTKQNFEDNSKGDSNRIKHVNYSNENGNYKNSTVKNKKHFSSDFHPKNIFSPTSWKKHKKQVPVNDSINNKSRPKTTMYRIASTQHITSNRDAETETKFENRFGFNTPEFMNSRTNPLFLNSIFSSPVSGRKYSLTPSKISETVPCKTGNKLKIIPSPISFNESLPDIQQPQSGRLLTAMCDSIIGDLKNNNKQALNQIRYREEVHSGDSGFGSSVTKKNSFKKTISLNDLSKILTTMQTKDFKKGDSASIHSTTESDLMKASKIVKDVLEHMHTEPIHITNDILNSDILMPTVNYLDKYSMLLPPKNKKYCRDIQGILKKPQLNKIINNTENNTASEAPSTAVTFNIEEYLKTCQNANKAGITKSQSTLLLSAKIESSIDNLILKNETIKSTMLPSTSSSDSACESNNVVRKCERQAVRPDVGSEETILVPKCRSVASKNSLCLSCPVVDCSINSSTSSIRLSISSFQNSYTKSELNDDVKPLPSKEDFHRRSFSKFKDAIKFVKRQRIIE